MTATALAATVGEGQDFSTGSQLAAYLGLVPRQASSGGKVRLLGISKRGDSYLRGLLIHSARSVIYHIQRRLKASQSGGNPWVVQLLQRCHPNEVAVALANKKNEGNLVTLRNRNSTILRNVVSGGNIIVNDNECVQQQVVTVVQNLISVGNAIVNCNEKADVKENKVTEGSIACRGNDRLDSKDNDAFGGTVNCSRSLFN